MAEASNHSIVWTSREARFTPFPNQTVDPERVLDALCDHYYERPLWRRRLVGPVLSGSAEAFEVTGLPVWMPAWWARRTVARIMADLGVGGRVESAAVRNVLE